MYGGTRLTVTGEGFGTDQSKIEVSVGDHNCVIESISSTQIICLMDSTSPIVKINNQGINPSMSYIQQIIVIVCDLIKWSGDKFGEVAPVKQ